MIMPLGGTVAVVRSGNTDFEACASSGPPPQGMQLIIPWNPQQEIGTRPISQEGRLGEEPSDSSRMSRLALLFNTPPPPPREMADARPPALVCSLPQPKRPPISIPGAHRGQPRRCVWSGRREALANGCRCRPWRPCPATLSAPGGGRKSIGRK